MATRHRPGWILAAALIAAGTVAATPIVPRSDSEVVEQLPVRVRISDNGDPAVAVREAGALLDASRQQGDPRFAGRALARLARWASDDVAPVEVAVMLASIEQFLHRFDSATQRLQAVVRRQPDQAQAWLMLATLHRLAGRYAASDEACRAVIQLRAQPYGDACVAENQALRGDFDAARQVLAARSAAARDAATRGWLATTLAELEQRAGRPAAAEAAWRLATQSGTDTYAAIGRADFLLDAQRPLEALNALSHELPTDPVLLRRAIAAKRAGRPEAAAWQQELHDRFALADQRPESGGHDRERALMALDVEGNAASALQAAQRNVQLQREPIDLWLLGRCAKAARDAGALAEAKRLAVQMGLRDARLDAL